MPECGWSPKPVNGVSLIVDEVKEHERFQETSKVGGRHEAGDGSMFLSTSPFGDSGKRTLFHNDSLVFHFVTTLKATSMFPRVALEYGHVWCAASTMA